MARIRTVKPEQFQSDVLSKVSLAAERTFFGLQTQADDRGRFPDKPATINGLLWAERSERTPHTTSDLNAELDDLAEAGAICRYEGCDGRLYLHSLTWDEDQKIDRPSRTRAPRCPVHGQHEDCGAHTGPCPPRESSRVLDSQHNGHSDDHSSRALVGVSRVASSPREDSSNRADLHEPGSSRVASSPREDSMLDLGPRTFKPPPTPPSAELTRDHPGPRSGEGEKTLAEEQTPGMDTLVAEILATRPEWAAEAITGALTDPAVAARPWPVVVAAMRIAAADLTTATPGRLKQNGPWWSKSAAIVRAAHAVNARPPDGQHIFKPDGRGECTQCPHPKKNWHHLKAESA